MLYITSPLLIYFIIGSLYFLTLFTHSTLPADTNLFSVSINFVKDFNFFLDSTYK